MQQYRYEGTDAAGKPVAGVVEAANEFDTRLRLRRMRIRSSSIARKQPFDVLSITRRLRRPGLKELATFTRQFAAMSVSGIPLVECLDAIAEQNVHREFQAIIRSVSGDVQSGQSLADALSRHPALFNRLYCAMVRAGESAGILNTVLLRLAEYQEKSAALQRRIMGALAYPALVSLVAAGALVALFVFVVPTFSAMLAELGASPPLSTRIVMAISAVVKTWLPAGFVLLAGCVVSAAYYYKRNEKFRFRADSFVLKLPYLGDLQKKSAVGRFARTFGALCAGGVPIAPALEITAATANNSVIEKGLFATLDAIRSGQTIAAPLRQTGVFPPMVVQMIAAGEKSGNLPDMLIRIADYYDTEVDSAIGTLSAVLEPALIVIMGVVVAGVLIAMYLPMFEMISAFG